MRDPASPALLIGCPVRRREWILPDWFASVRLACSVADIDDYEYVFVVDALDAPTLSAIERHANRPVHLVSIEEPARDDVREWNAARYSHMVFLRNALLEKVREVSPGLFWSVDSDMLVGQRTLSSALELLEMYDAVGSKAYMTPEGTWCPSYSQLVGAGCLSRPDSDGALKVDVIMAIKLMTPKAYAVDYEMHLQGEDIGWSIAARQANARLGWDGRTLSHHVMERP